MHKHTFVQEGQMEIVKPVTTVHQGLDGLCAEHPTKRAPLYMNLKKHVSQHSISIASKQKGSFRLFILLPDWLQVASKVCGSAPLSIKYLNSSTQSATSMKLSRYIPTRLRKKCHFNSASWWRYTGQFLSLPSTAAITVKLCM